MAIHLTREEEFDRLFARWGGRSNSNDVLDTNPLLSARSAIEWIRSTNNNMAQVHIDLIENNNFMAKALISDDKYFIGISTGAIFVITSLFHRMFANPNILSWIGEPQLETERIKIPNIELLNKDALIDYSESFAISNCQIRVQMALLLMDIAINYIIYHEFAHVVNGHLGLLQSEGSELDLLDMQTFEMDADSFAAHWTFTHLRNISQFPNLIPDLQNIFECLEDLIHLGCFAIHSIWRLWGPTFPEKHALEKSTHPPEAMRQFIHGATTATILLKNNLYFPNVFANAVNDSEQAFSEISDTSVNTNAILAALSDDGRAHLSKIMKNWKNLRPKLEPYATARLVPIQDDSKFNF